LAGLKNIIIVGFAFDAGVGGEVLFQAGDGFVQGLQQFAGYQHQELVLLIDILAGFDWHICEEGSFEGEVLLDDVLRIQVLQLVAEDQLAHFVELPLLN
jgi:hypothetical protein